MIVVTHTGNWLLGPLWAKCSTCFCLAKKLIKSSKPKNWKVAVACSHYIFIARSTSSWNHDVPLYLKKTWLICTHFFSHPFFALPSYQPTCSVHCFCGYYCSVVIIFSLSCVCAQLLHVQACQPRTLKNREIFVRWREWQNTLYDPEFFSALSFILL